MPGFGAWPREINMRFQRSNLLWALAATALVALLAGTSRAGPIATGPNDDTVTFSDLTEGVPTVTATGGTIAVVFSAPDFLHITFTSSDLFFSGQGNFDMLEQGTGALSDRLLFTGNGTNVLDLQFDSESQYGPLPVVNPATPITEDGTSQQLANVSGLFFVYAASDVNEIPEPASLTVLGIGVASLAGYGWQRRRRAA
jgi:hypothetical protein